MLRKLIVFGVLLGALCGGAYWYWTTTPQYAVEEMRAAMRTHDLEKFQTFVNVDNVSDGLVDDFVAEPMQRITGGGITGQVIMAGIAAFIKPAIAVGVKREIITFVETGSFSHRPAPSAGQAADPDMTAVPNTTLTPGNPLNQTLTLHHFDDKFGFRKHAFRQFKDVKIDGDNAEVGVLLHNQVYDTDLLLKLDLTHNNGHWKIARLANFPEFIAELARLQLQKDKTI